MPKLPKHVETPWKHNAYAMLIVTSSLMNNSLSIGENIKGAIASGIKYDLGHLLFLLPLPQATRASSGNLQRCSRVDQGGLAHQQRYR